MSIDRETDFRFVPNHFEQEEKCVFLPFCAYIIHRSYITI